METNVKRRVDMFDSDKFVALLGAVILTVFIGSMSSCHYAAVASHNKCVVESSEASAQFCKNKL